MFFDSTYKPSDDDKILIQRLEAFITLLNDLKPNDKMVDIKKFLDFIESVLRSYLLDHTGIANIAYRSRTTVNGPNVAQTTLNTIQTGTDREKLNCAKTFVTEQINCVNTTKSLSVTSRAYHLLNGLKKEDAQTSKDMKNILPKETNKTVASSNIIK